MYFKVIVLTNIVLLSLSSCAMEIQAHSLLEDLPPELIAEIVSKHIESCSTFKQLCAELARLRLLNKHFNALFSTMDNKVMQKMIYSFEKFKDSSQEEKNSYLIRATQFNNVAGVALSLKIGSFVNCQNPIGQTPLHIAVKQENLEISNLLLSKGADTQAEDFYSTVPGLYRLYTINSRKKGKDYFFVSADTK